MRLKLTFFILVILFLFYGGVEAQPINHQQKATASLRLIYDGKYDSAKFLLKTFGEGEEAMKELIEVFSMRWEFIPIVRSGEKELYLKKLQATIEKLKVISPVSPTTLYMHAIAELLVAEFHYTNGDATQAIWHGKKAYPLMMQTFEKVELRPELLFIQGMYLYYSEFFRNRGFMYRAALFPLRGGDEQEGLALLEKTAEQESLAQVEALIYLAHIYLHLEKRPDKALPYSRKLVEQFPRNLKFKELLIDNLISVGLPNEALVMLNEQVQSPNAYFKIPALYFRGLIERTVEKKPSKAIATFKACIALAEKNDLWEDYLTKAEIQLEELEN